MNSVVEHIIIGGGGMYGFSCYGAIKEAEKKGLYSLSAIKSIYGTSVGAMIGALLCLKYDWDILDAYIIERPWDKVFQMEITTLFDSVINMGAFDISIMTDIFKPLLLGKGLDTDCTLLHLYEYSGIELHVFATELNTFSSIDISWKTHPEWKVIDAVYSSACLPGLFRPHFADNGKIYVDGGLYKNYPYPSIPLDGKHIGFYSSSMVTEINTLSPMNSLVDLFIYISIKSWRKLQHKIPTHNNNNIEICIPQVGNTVDEFMTIVSNIDERMKKVAIGIDIIIALLTNSSSV